MLSENTSLISDRTYELICSIKRRKSPLTRPATKANFELLSLVADEIDSDDA